MDISLTRGVLAHGGRPNLLPFGPLHSTPTSQQWPPSNLRFSTRKPLSSQIRVRVSATGVSSVEGEKNPVVRRIKNAAKTVILTTTFAALTLGRFSGLPARAEAPATLTEEKQDFEEEETKESPLSQFLESHSDAVDALKSLLQRKLEDGEDEEALKILRRLVEVQPSEVEWKFLMARLLNEMAEKGEARKVYEEILAVNPLSFEALFENALLMDRCGEGVAVSKRLEDALELAEEEQKSKEARDVRLIMAQIQFLQKNVDEALMSYKELAKEDPEDFRPFFCQGVIYSLLDKNEEAREQFAKYHDLSPKKFEVEGFLQTPLTRMKLFGTDSEN
ncbi:protein SLOW GREEN 1, chloroplastic-like [Macadamia integrifolia]|uniref:protein SLOW GREEN 1, chloroplastic-like n=1 Tax=Macadamia integrifolia TaxID=60698 RepID=UPI001C4EC2EB|nr:protein SLOW GREEN 1, chloroplastic-like [Macadamia integrifolia]XP_042505438.1 protein SLOW GREEN 1, chloroplastic-like [Macadamia integrifolia]XP_042505439.1 protein SLOW GREEN 1, chloroplastic-like [Macadamia integrifolia]